MRDKIIDYFIGEPEEVTLPQELLFYLTQATPVIIFIIIMILV